VVRLARHAARCGRRRWGTRVTLLGGALLVGVLFGMLHALEADHLAAVATLAVRQTDRRRIVAQGVFWGVGHTLTLLAVAGSLLVLGVALSERWAHALEGAVGAMLVLLGADLLRRLHRDRVHFHAHAHADDAPPHFHAHSHRGEARPHVAQAHRHAHGPVPLRALAVGTVHGLAGSSALVLLAAQQVSGAWSALLYVLVFGAGSIVGMASLSWAVSWPLRLGAARLTRLHRGFSLAVGLFGIGLGAQAMARHWWPG
jgi:ABC-type nickel/cobalt efflux system permease component RcnA